MAPLDRRGVLAGGAALGGLALLSRRARAGVRLWASPRLDAGAARGGAPRTLLLVQLTGGNDGLNTVVPFADEAYRAARPEIGIPVEQVLQLDARVGLHPALPGLSALFDAKRLAVVQGVGYPEPNRSHFQALEIWHAANTAGRGAGEGWIGRLAGELFGEASDPNHVVHVGAREPWSLASRAHPAACFPTAAGYGWAGDALAIERVADELEHRAGTEGETGNAALARLRGVLADAHESSRAVRRAVASYRPHAEYPPNSELAGALYTVAALAQAELGTRVFSVELDGFDTHNDQPGRHAELLRSLDASLTAFLRDVSAGEAGERLLVLVFSEFGRRLAENASRGTDHGAAAPMLLAGAPVAGGIYGAHPSLTELDERGDLLHTTDFRSVYAAAVEWMGADPERVLGAGFEPLRCLRA